MTRPRLILLDRDGTVIVDAHYLHDPEKVQLIAGAAEAIARLNRRGHSVAVVSNQSGVGRGLFSEARMHAVNARMEQLLARHGAHLDAIYCCTDPPGVESACRKPEPGMLLRASRELGLPLANAVMIGDKAADIQAGLAVGATTVLVLTGYGARVAAAEEASPHHTAEDLAAAIDWVLRGRAGEREPMGGDGV